MRNSSFLPHLFPAKVLQTKGRGGKPSKSRLWRDRLRAKRVSTCDEVLAPSLGPLGSALECVTRAFWHRPLRLAPVDGWKHGAVDAEAPVRACLDYALLLENLWRLSLLPRYGLGPAWSPLYGRKQMTFFTL